MKFSLPARSAATRRARASPTFDLGTLGNTISGLVGGGVLGQLIPLVLPAISAAVQGGESQHRRHPDQPDRRRRRRRDPDRHHRRDEEQGCLSGMMASPASTRSHGAVYAVACDDPDAHAACLRKRLSAHASRHRLLFLAAFALDLSRPCDLPRDRQPAWLQHRLPAVPLRAVFDETGGLPLPKRHPVRQRYRLMDLQRWRERRDVPLVLQPKHFPFDPSPRRSLPDRDRAGGRRSRPFHGGGHGRRLGARRRHDAARGDARRGARDRLRRAGAARRRRQRGRAAASTRARSQARSRPASSVRRAMCSMARCSGGRTGSNCSTARWPAAARPIAPIGA